MVWGSAVVLFPDLPFRWAGIPQPNYPELWQCIGMIVGVYGIGYAIAAFDLERGVKFETYCAPRIRGAIRGRWRP